MKMIRLLSIGAILIIGGFFAFKKSQISYKDKSSDYNDFNKEEIKSKQTQDLLFYQSRRKGQGNLFLMDENGQNVRQIGQSGSRPDHYPNWSPDGQYITFESYRRGGWRIWIMKADGSEARRVLNGRSGTSTYEFDPSFSYDGKRIFFCSNGDLFSVKRDGNDLQQITSTPDQGECSPYQSPDGKHLLYVAESQIYLMNMANKKVKKLSPDKQVIEYAPIWSPDGSQILFYSMQTGSFELYLMDGDGSNRRSLLSAETLKKYGFTKTKFIDPWDPNWGGTDQYKASFSPDGKRIAFSRNVGDQREIFTAKLDGTDLKRLTRNQVHDGFPIWRP